MNDFFIFVCKMQIIKLNQQDFHLLTEINQLITKTIFFQMPGHFVNDIHSCVDESLIGYVRAHSHLELAGRAVIARSQVPSVAIISGSGSGHEPATVNLRIIGHFKH